MNQKEYDHLYGFSREETPGLKARIARSVDGLRHSFCSAEGLYRLLRRRVPATRWLPAYRWRQSLFGDLAAGATLGIYNIPQGMAYSVLASLPPVYGLYASFYPPLLYFLFGSSFHSSLGVFSITSLLTGMARREILPDFTNGTSATTIEGVPGIFEPIDVAVALALTVGLLQLAMAALRLDFVTAYLSDPVVSGFNLGAACHALIAQVPTLLGVHVRKNPSNLFVLFYNTLDICEAVRRANLVTVGVSAASIVFLFVSKLLAGKTRRLKLLPTELILMIVGAFLSWQFELADNHSVKIIDEVATGIPPPRVPDVRLIPHLWHSALSIAIVSFAVTVSMGKLFAKKHKYSIDSNQELLALGMSGTLSSFFTVFPCTTSLSRSLVNEAAGARSQVSGAVSSVIVLVVIMWIGPFLQTLPLCILASIVVVALRSLFMRVTELPYLWRFSKIDFTAWLITAVATICYDIIPGLAVGILFSVLTVVCRVQFASTRHLVEVAPSDFRDSRHFPSSPPPQCNIIRFDAAPCFTNCERMRRKILEEAERICQTMPCLEKIMEEGEKGQEKVFNRIDDSWACIVLDCSTWTFTDSMGIETVRELHLELCNRKILLLFANVRSSVRVAYAKSGLYDVLSDHQFFPSISDARNVASGISVASSFLPFPDLHNKLATYIGSLAQ